MPRSRAALRRLPRVSLPCLLLLAASPTLASPSLTVEIAYSEAGLTGYDVGLAFDDEPASVFVEYAIFTGSFNQIRAFGSVDVDSDEDAGDYDGVGGYDMNLDSYFITSDWLGSVGAVVGGEPGSTEYSRGPMEGGGGNLVTEIRLAYLVLPAGEPFLYDIKLSRGGQTYYLVPEPAEVRLQLAAVGTLALLVRRRARATRQNAGTSRTSMPMSPHRISIVSPGSPGDAQPGSSG